MLIAERDRTFRTHEVKVLELPSVSFGRLLSPETDYSFQFTPAQYEALNHGKDCRFYPVVLQKGNKMKVIAPTTPLDGADINHFLFFAAPGKSTIFGLDTGDVINDWPNLYRHEFHRDRLAEHRKIPGWDGYEKVKDTVYDAIEEFDRGLLGQFRKLINPVLAVEFALDEFGTEKIETEISDEERQLVQEALSQFYLPDEFFLPQLGPLMLAAYSPEATSVWGARRSYHEDCKGQQTMGPTQVLPLSIGLAQSLLDGEMAQNFLAYIRSQIQVSSVS